MHPNCYQNKKPKVGLLQNPENRVKGWQNWGGWKPGMDNPNRQGEHLSGWTKTVGWYSQPDFSIPSYGLVYGGVGDKFNVLGIKL